MKVRAIQTSGKGHLRRVDTATEALLTLPDGGRSWETNYVMRYTRIT